MSSGAVVLGTPDSVVIESDLLEDGGGLGALLGANHGCPGILGCTVLDKKEGSQQWRGVTPGRCHTKLWLWPSPSQ